MSSGKKNQWSNSQQKYVVKVVLTYWKHAVKTLLCFPVNDVKIRARWYFKFCTTKYCGNIITMLLENNTSVIGKQLFMSFDCSIRVLYVNLFLSQIPDLQPICSMSSHDAIVVYCPALVKMP